MTGTTDQVSAIRIPVAAALLWALLSASSGCSAWRQSLAGHCRCGQIIESPADTLIWASRNEQADHERSVELYLRAAKLSYHDLPASWSEYHQSVAGLLRTAQRFGRYEPGCGVCVNGNTGRQFVAMSFHGFAWRPADFSRLVVADPTVRTDLKQQHGRSGVGVPLIVIREEKGEEKYHAKRTHFAATVNLKPVCDDQGSQRWILELANPLEVRCTEVGGRSLPLASDQSASTRYLLEREKRTYLTDFLRPGVSTAEPQLILTTPYQRSKIPLIFVHGLLSDPITWAELHEAVKADQELHDRYQVWAFQYPTGRAFLTSAADLRRELTTLVACVAPDGSDPALGQMVLVGHSMGGLLGKLQVTSSEDRLWRSIANRSLGHIHVSEDARRRLAEAFFFDPVPQVRRIIYIGTPHDGSGLANRWFGRLGSRLVRTPQNEEFERLLENNPGVFNPFVGTRIPTSVDLLEPDNPILGAMAALPVAPGVQMHSIIGTGGCAVLREPSDGVVPVASAKTSGVSSELLIDARHESLHHDEQTIAEVVRILRRHLVCLDTNL